jgi:hypothetical protein
VRFTPQFLRALHLELFTKPSTLDVGGLDLLLLVNYEMPVLR